MMTKSMDLPRWSLEDRCLQPGSVLYSLGWKNTSIVQVVPTDFLSKMGIFGDTSFSWKTYHWSIEIYIYINESLPRMRIYHLHILQVFQLVHLWLGLYWGSHLCGGIYCWIDGSNGRVPFFWPLNSFVNRFNHTLNWEVFHKKRLTFGNDTR